MTEKEFEQTLEWIKERTEKYCEVQFRLAVIRGYLKSTDQEKTFTVSQISRILELTENK